MGQVAIEAEEHAINYNLPYQILDYLAFRSASCHLEAYYYCKMNYNDIVTD